MFKLAGCIMLIAAGTYGGFAMADRLRRQRDHLHELLKMVENIEIYLSAEFLTAEEIMVRLGGNPELSSLDFLKNISGDDITLTAAENIRSSECEYIQCIKDSLCAYFEDFGKSDIKGQTAKTSLLKAETADMYRFYKEKYEKYSKLYRVMGFSIGMMSAIMLM